MAGEPCLKDTADDIEGSSLDNTTTDGFRAADTDVDDALEGEGKAVGGMFVVLFREERGYGFGGASAGWGEAVKQDGCFGRRRGYAKVAKETNETFETAVHGHDLAYARRGGGEVDEVGERVE